MRWWQLPGGCFSRISFFQTQRLPALEKIFPRIGPGENARIIAQVEVRWIERRLYIGPMERHGERRLVAAANRIRSNNGSAECIAKRVQINALSASFNALLHRELLGMIGGEALTNLLGEGQHVVVIRAEPQRNENMQTPAAGRFGKRHRGQVCPIPL